MNFNFNNQRNFHIGNPIMRHFSTIGLMTAKTDFGLKSESFIRNMPNNLFSTYADTNGNKSFSNPNFVNKHHPNILTPSVAGIINFDKPKYNNTPHLQQQPKHHEHIIQKQQQPTEEQTSSSQIEITTTDDTNHEENMVESVKKSRHQRKKNRRSSKRAKNDCDEKKSKPPSSCMIKKLCSSPKKPKKDHEPRRKSKKSKPWHKISFHHEILMDCDDLIPPPDSPFEPPCPLMDSCVFKSSPIDIKPSCPSETFSISFSPDILKSLSSSSSDLSSASPAIHRLRVPSECESEDSFIVFCDDTKSAASEQSLSSDCSDEDDDDDEEYTGSCDSDIDFVDFAEKTDLNHGDTKKKVSFKCDKELCTVYPMIKWDFAYRAARKGPWEEYARDRSRFKCRIRNTESILSGILSEKHRDKIYKQRFTKNEL